MRFPKLLFLLLVIAAGCSNSKTDSDENADTTSVASNAVQAEEINLTPQELERLRVELFHYLRQNEAYIADNLTYVQQERFTLYDKGFKYAATYSAAEDDPDDMSPEIRVSGDIDSVWIDANYKIVSTIKSPEGGITSVTLLYSGRKITDEWTSYSQVSYEAGESYGQQVEKHEQIHNDNSIPEKTITIEVREPRIYSRDNMYLKMRITTISDKDLSGLSKDELREIRNEVFARHGHTFKTPEMIAYFNKQDWYNAYVNDATPFLNDIEKKNVEFIKAKEQG